MQGLSDGYFVLPYTIQNYLADQIRVPRFETNLPEFEEAEKAAKERIEKLLAINGTETVDTFHRRLGLIMWDLVGMSRKKEDLEKAITMIQELRKEFWKNVKVPGKNEMVNPELEKAIRVADYLELGELMARDALVREESCGGHFREEYQTEDGEALRDDKNFTYVSAWEYTGEDKEPKLNKEPLVFEFIEVKQRNYK
jgi:succinate dehydrogenase / fumarate reductase flavoprotein subunit